MQKRGRNFLHSEKKEIEQRRQKALAVSIKEGSASSVASGIAETYITPLALALKATPLHIGFLSALANLIAPLTQLFGDKLMESHSRKTIVRKFVFLQALMFLPLAALSYLFWKNVAVAQLPLLLILLYTALAGLGGIAFPAWFSWMGDLVPAEQRGRYFGKRQRITGAVGLIAILVLGFVLDALKTKGLLLIGFSILFFIAFLARISAFFLFKKQYTPQFKLNKRDYFSIWAFLKRHDNFGKFAIGHAFFNLTLMIASPFFSVYMLKNLGLENNYALFTIINMSSTIFFLIFTPLVGKFADRYGNKKLFSLACILFSINPLLWMLTINPYLLIPIQIVAGFANAGLVLAVNNFTYDAVSPQKRALCITYTNILAGVGVFIGSLLGGFIIKSFHPAGMNPLLFVFLISSFGRLLITFFLIPQIKEERHVKPLHNPHLSLFHPFKSLNSEVHWLKRLFV